MSYYIVEWKPLGRGRHFDRLARGLARRMRIPYVRQTLHEIDNPWTAYPGTTYGPPWTSQHALADFSFACRCHKGERYSRKDKHKAAD